MTIAKLLILQLIAHVLADYIFQNDKWAKDKNRNGARSKYFIWHLAITFILSWILSFQLIFFIASLAITITHGFIDALKYKFLSNKRIKRYAFYIDQLLHLIAILVIVLLFNRFFELNPIFNMPIGEKYLAVFAAYLICLKPANVIIKEIFYTYNIEVSNKKSGENIPNAGKLIGIAERIIALTLIIFGQFEIVGFLIAGKSILRFKESDTSKTEYVLIGTLLSFGIAIIMGVAILNIY